MKKFIPLFLFALVAMTHQASAVEASTDPVGFVSKTLPAGSDTTVSAAVQRPAAFVGTVGAITDADTIQISGVPGWTANQFKNTHYLLIGSGDREGVFAEIVANTGDSVDLVFFVGNLGTATGDKVNVGDQVKIVPFWTLGTLIPDGSVPDSSTVLLYDRSSAGINKSASTTYTMYTGYGWYNGATPGANQVIYPDESLIVRTPSGSPVTLTQVGSVPMDKARTLLKNVGAGAQDIRMTSGVPVPVALGTLLAPGASGDQDTVLIFDDSQAGINKSATLTATYYNGYGWYNGATDLNSTLIQPGQGFIYRKGAANAAQDITVNFKPSYQP